MALDLSTSRPRAPAGLSSMLLLLPFAQLRLTFARMRRLHVRMWCHGRTRFFAPRLSISNLITTDHEDLWYKFKPHQSVEGSDAPAQTEVELVWLLEGTFQNKFGLKMFPFDEQDLCVDLKTGYELQHKVDPVLLVKNQDAKCKSVISVRNFVQDSEYYLHPRVQFEQCETDPDESASGCTYSRILLKMRVSTCGPLPPLRVPIMVVGRDTP